MDDLERRIEILDEVHQANQELVRIRADKLRAESVLQIVDLESCKTRLEAKQEDLEGISAKISELEERYKILDADKKEKTEALIEVKAELHSSDYGVKQKEMEELKNTISLLKGNARQWQEILQGLREWETDEEISGYISNPTLQCLEEVLEGGVSEHVLDKLRSGIQNGLEMIREEMADLSDSIRSTARELSEKKEMAEDLKHDRKPYRKALKSARAQLQSELSSQYGRTIHVEIFADLFDIVDEKWKEAIEGRLGRIKHSLVTEPQ